MKKTIKVTDSELKEHLFVMEVQSTPNGKAHHISCTGDQYYQQAVVHTEDLEESIESMEHNCILRFGKTFTVDVLKKMGFS